MIDYTTIGRNIRKRRLEKGLTQEAIAEMLDVTPDYISKIEHAQKHPSLKVLDAFAGIFGIELYELIGGTNPNSEDYEIPELYCLIKDWEPETRLLLLKTADTFSGIDKEIKQMKNRT